MDTEKHWKITCFQHIKTFLWRTNIYIFFCQFSHLSVDKYYDSFFQKENKCLEMHFADFPNSFNTCQSRFANIYFICMPRIECNQVSIIFLRIIFNKRKLSCNNNWIPFFQWCSFFWKMQKIFKYERSRSPLVKAVGPQPGGQEFNSKDIAKNVGAI